MKRRSGSAGLVYNLVMGDPRRMVGHGLLYVATTAAVLLALEGTSRLVRPVERPAPLVPSERADWLGRLIEDPVLFWRLAPSWSDDGQVTTNALGFRGPEVPPKDPGEFRVLSLGASVTYAGRLPYEACYSAILQQRLDRLDGRAVRVINTGVPGWTLLQGIKFLEHRGLRLRPDMVVTYFGKNNFSKVTTRASRSGEATNRTGLTDRELFEARRGILPRLMYVLKERSNLVRIVTRASSDSATVLVSGKVPRVPVSDQEQLLRELQEICTSRNVRLVIVIPWYRYFREHIPVLRSVARDGNTLVVDVPAHVADIRRPQDYFLDRDHLNARGHRRVAEIIAQEIQDFWPDLIAGRTP